MPELPSGTVTFLFTDIEGSTRLLQELGDGYADALAEHRRLLREAFERHRGAEVDTQGDAFFVAFERASDALAAAHEGQKVLAPGPVRVRMGVHSGEPTVTEEGYVGIDVHRAARIAAAGHGGQILLSQAARDLVGRDDLRDLGEHRLKDLSAPERIFQLGDRDFPRLKTLYQTNMPVPATPFLGRERELAEVSELLSGDGARVVTLTGPGGTGKTRLALQAAAECVEHFPDSITWVPLASLRDPALALGAIAEANGIKEEPGRSLQDALASALGGRRILLLLDNAEHLLPGLAEQLTVVRAIEGPRLLVTSRERLQVQGERVYAVAPLEQDDAVRLFLERSAALGAELESSATIVEICGRLDDLPLAVELAAARTPLFSPEQLLERLGGKLDLLKGGRDVDPRQQTLRATIEWSHELLSEEERRLFRRLAVFVGGCSLEWAERVSDADPDTLQSLLDKNLVRRRQAAGASRFWMLETIREYAIERLQESGESALLEDRLIDAACDFARAAEPAWRVGGVDKWIPQFEVERANLRRAIAAALERGDPKRALTISTYLGWLWQMSGSMREGMKWTAQGLAAATDLEAGLEGYARFVVASAHMELDEPDLALELLPHCLALLEAGGLKHHHAFALYYLGEQLLDLGRVEEAEEALSASEREALALADPTLIWAANDGLAHALAARGDRQRARAIREELDDFPNSSHKVSNRLRLVELLAADGETARAVSLLDGARRICEEGGYRRELAWVLQLQGVLDVAAGRRSPALAALETARSMGEESGVRGVEGPALLGLAAAEARWGSAERAVELWSHAQALGATSRTQSWSLDRKLEQEFLEPLRDALPEETFDRAWSAGAADVR
jgi:predicted ATPase